MFFKKKDERFEENLRQEKENMKLAIKKAKLVADFFNELSQGCISDDGLKERLMMAKENNPVFFKDNASKIKAEMQKRNLGHITEMIEVGNNLKEKTLSNLKEISKLNNKNKELEHQE